jgi:superfamily I DNA/RNA helicase
MALFNPSPQQAQYFNWITTGKGSALLEAVAGSGKTTTLIEGLKLMKGDIFFGAYNKKICEEIKAKAPQVQGLNISTMHAAGFAIWRRVASRVQVDSAKVGKIWSRLVPKTDNDLMGPVCQLVSLAKQAAFGAVLVPTDNDWMGLIDHFNVDCLDQDDKAVDLAKMILAENNRTNTETIDFDDMILAPLLARCKVKEYDWVLIDEAQDTNASRRVLALLMLKRGGRMVAVGDPHQAIYGFTGADSDSLDLIASAVSACRIPLTVSYRCPKKVTELARTWVNHIQSHPSAIEGHVSTLKDFDAIYGVAQTGDAILCRFNAPLVQMVYTFIAQGIPARIEGRDIGTNLKTIVKRFKVKGAEVLLNKLTEYQERETSRLRMKQKESLAVAVEDKIKCIQVLVARVSSINPGCTDYPAAVCAEINKLFGDKVRGNEVRLSTIHRSKGMEWKRVFWVQTGMPKWVRKSWESDQEVNLMYVAVTRSQSELYLVPEPKKKN